MRSIIGRNSFTSGSSFVLLLVVLVLAGLPVLYMGMGAFRAGVTGGFSLDHIRNVFFSTKYLPSLLSSLQLATTAAGVALVVGLVVAWVMSRLSLPGKSILEIGILSPIFISPFIGAIGWVTLGQPSSGLVNGLLRQLGLPEVNVISYGGTVFIMTMFFVPYVYMMLRHTMDRLNPEFEEAARICGGNVFRTTVGVTLPMLAPSLFSAFIITFIFGIEMFSIPGLLIVPFGYSILAYDIYSQTVRFPVDQAEASALGLLLLLITVIGMLAYAYAVRAQERFVTIGPKTARQEADKTWSLGRILAFVAIILYILLSSVLPTSAIILRAFLPYVSSNVFAAKFTLANIQYTLNDQVAIDSLVNSLIVTAIAVVLLMTIAFLVALGRVRRPGILSNVIWVMASIPIAVPGILTGLGLVWLYIGSPVYGTLAIIVLAMLARFMPIAVRLFETGLMQIGRELEEAAAICSASESRVTWSIRLPLLGATLRSVVTVAGTDVFNELSATALLFTSASSVLPVVIFNYMFDGDYSRAAALALLQIVFLTAGLGLIALVSGILSRSARYRIVDGKR